MSEFVTVATFIGRVQADLAAAHLQAFEIPVRIEADDGGGTIPSLQLGSGVKLLVETSKESEALELLLEGGHIGEPEEPKKPTRNPIVTWVIMALVVVSIAWVFLSAVRYHSSAAD